MSSITIGKSRIHGRGLIATKPLKRNQHIGFITGRDVHVHALTAHGIAQRRNWFAISSTHWIDPTGTPYQFLNHSCAPNAAVAGRKTLVSLRPIAAGEEITIDYSLTDLDPFSRFNCGCRAPQCRRVITSLFMLPIALFKQNRVHIPLYFRQRYAAFRRRHVASTYGTRT